MCKYSSFDRTYQVKYNSEDMITYVGIEKTIITFDFVDKIWIIRDVTNPDVYASSKASFRSLAIGNHEWSINNDAECNQEIFKTVLSLTSCSDSQFTCNDGLCISISNRFIDKLIIFKFHHQFRNSLKLWEFQILRWVFLKNNSIVNVYCLL